MAKEFKLTFTPDTAKYVTDVYGQSKVIVEYGSGGSTLLAASLGRQVISVESCKPWLDDLVESCNEAKLPGQLVPLWADIGTTGDWGYPVDKDSWPKWKNYPAKPWIYCAEHEIDPDVVLIDGRFRVACFLATAVSIRKPVTVLFDDYTKREYYHCVEAVTKPERLVDSRMAVFQLKPGLIDARALLANLGYFQDVR